MRKISLRPLAVQPWEPLWKRVPTRSDEGELLSDFMMLIPGLSRRPRHQLLATVDQIQVVFDRYHHAVAFADLNLRLNLLWISVKPIPGICLELAAALRMRVPEAVLIAHKFTK